MPRNVSKVSKNFILTPVGDNLAVSSTNEDLNTRNVCIIYKNETLVINGPEVDEDLGREYGILTPTLLEPNFFFRETADTENNNVGSLIEVFEYFEGEFFIVNEYHLSFRRVKLLNRRFLLRTGPAPNHEKAFYVYDLYNKEVIYTYIFNHALRFLVQDDVAYIFYHNGSGYEINMVFVFINGIPTLIKDHPLSGFVAVACDRTPGNNRFLFERDDELYTCSVDNEDVIWKPCEKIMHRESMNDVAIILDVFVPHPFDSDDFPHIYCKARNFLLLDGNVYNVHYDYDSFVTTFFQVFKHYSDCLFILNKNTAPMPQDRFSVLQQEFPVIVDYYKHSLGICSPSSAFADQKLQRAFEFYNIDERQWHVGYVTMDQSMCRLFVNEKMTTSFPKLDDAQRITVVFNSRHYAVSYRRQRDFGVIVNGQTLGKHRVRYVQIVGDVCWILNGSDLSMNVLDSETGAIVDSKEHQLDIRVRDHVHNPYCPEEIFFKGLNRSIIVKYSEHSDDFRVFEVDHSDNNACFIDVGVLLYGKSVYIFDNEELIRRKMRATKGPLYTPEPGVVVEHRWSKGLEVFIRIIKFEDGKLRGKTEFVSMIDVLSNYDISSVFSSFGGFRRRVR
ncbi:hypothetical protein PCE1_002740 [Barthelona sp. PCE]